MIIRDNTKSVIDFVKKYLPEDPVVVEAGGYTGADTIQFARQWPKGTIYTFEPVPSLFAQLKEITRSFENIFLFPYALTDKNGEDLIYLSESYSFPGHTVGSNSLLQPLEHLFYDDSIHFVDQICVQSITLDDWARKRSIQKVDFLWLDMQGYELHMLEKSETAKTANVIYLEVFFVEAYKDQYLYQDVKKWMKQNGFSLKATDFDEKKLNCYFGNALFINTKRMK